MADAKYEWDVIVIGSGIGGSSLAAVLARHGRRVLVLEAGQHPRFTIGESMILETSEMMRALAKFYDVPELARFSSENYLSVAGTSHGVKRHFGYVHHRADEPLDISRTLEAIIPEKPYGHELHLFRQDTDAYLTSIAISYGAEVKQGTLVIDVDIDAPSGVTVTTNRGEVFGADYLVDAGGYRSFVAEKLGWRNRELATHTRGMYTHMIDVPCFHDISAPRSEFGIPFRLSEGTLHHIFEGGWAWVIPFDNHVDSTNPLCSVGLLLDPRVFPARDYLDPETEFREVIGMFPGIAAQFEHASTVRPWVRSSRIQYTSDHVVGDRCALLGQAAGFVDPLYSKGLYTTHMAVMVLADLLLHAADTGDYSAAAFSRLERSTLGALRMNDRLVANSFTSWRHYELWRVYSVVWLLGAYLEYLMLRNARVRAADRSEYLYLLRDVRLAGGGFDGFFELQEKIDALYEAVDPGDPADVEKTVTAARELLEGFPWLPDAFRGVLNGRNHLPKRKFRLKLLGQSTGFMGNAAYREHFFGSMSLGSLLRGAMDDQREYSVRGIRRFMREHRRFRRGS